MKSGSITFKLLLLVTGAFLLSSLGVLIVANTHLKRIIDRSQDAMYAEKVEGICKALEGVDARLRKTGLVEAYIDDFQESVVAELRAYHYQDPDPLIYPFILDGGARVVMHPLLPAGDRALQDHALAALLRQSKAGGFVADYAGVTKWYGFRKFEAWDWTVVYVVPLDVKYHDARVFIRTLAVIMAGITLLVLGVLTVILTRFTSPIVRLTDSVSHMASGELDCDISVEGKDEVARLSRSFIHMRDEIRKKIADLNDEIHERKQAENKLQQSQKMDAIGQLAGGIAHDFNNMLGGIMGAAELLEEYLVKDPQAEKLYRMIMSSSERAAALTGKLLTFSRKEPGEFSVLDMHKAINDTVSLLQRTLDRRVTLQLDLGALESQVSGNESQLQAVILNLVINASHAMPDGGTIAISTRTLTLEPEYCEASMFELEPGPHLEIEIRDTGCGMAPDVLSRIFEPFFTTKKTGQGTGLGLSVAFGTIQQHHGAITVYSEVGQGTCFHLLLPLSREAAGQCDEPPQNVVHGEGRILVVDDEPVVRFTARAILENLGYEVALAENGKQALQELERQPESYDLVILDMIMPEMTGRECFRAMRQVNPEIRIAISSGFSREGEIAEMQAEGLNGYLRKPYRRAALSQMVAEILAP